MKSPSLHSKPAWQYKLARYGTLAASLAPATALAAVQYTDLDPDATTTTSGSLPAGNVYELDLNGDGQIDIRFDLYRNQDNYYGVNYSYSYVYAAPYGEYASKPAQNAIAFANRTVSGIDGSYTYPFAQNLALGTVINARLDFDNPDPDYSGTNLSRDLEANGLYYGQPINIDEKEATFGDNQVGIVGLRFEAAGAVHYGWVRLSVRCNVGEHPRITVYDYAYEDAPNTAIEAGEGATTTPTALTPFVAEGGKLFSHGSEITVQLPASFAQGGSLSLLNLQGQLLRQERVTSGRNRLLLDLPRGIYIARLEDETGTALAERKVLLQ